MSIKRELLDFGSFRRLHDSFTETAVIGERSDFLRADDRRLAKEWESVRPGRDINTNPITANPLYYGAGRYAFSLLHDNGQTFHIEINIKELAEPSRAFPDAPVREGVVDCGVIIIGKMAYGGNYFRLNTKDVFGGNDFKNLSDEEICDYLADTIMEHRHTLQRNVDEIFASRANDPDPDSIHMK